MFPTRIPQSSGIIDWQSSSINPAFMRANEVPDFAAPILTPEDHISTTVLRAGTNAKLCSEAFIAGVRLLVPMLYATWRLDDVTRFLSTATGLTEMVLEYSGKY